MRKIAFLPAGSSYPVNLKVVDSRRRIVGDPAAAGTNLLG
jgi:hypothetical protein